MGVKVYLVRQFLNYYAVKLRFYIQKNKLFSLDFFKKIKE
ncbi:hypothetical protein HMPREF9071_1282 [Capnocytophaga sp. oral taxon 338 str. F0234]|nr:hypothetical protein HMPREF9071_1282 [Capnocytophaga sp. oral taxon 338 str. F0234]